TIPWPVTNPDLPGRESRHARLAIGFVGLRSCSVAIQPPSDDISNIEITGPSGPDGVTPSRGQVRAFTGLHLQKQSPSISAATHLSSQLTFSTHPQPRTPGTIPHPITTQASPHYPLPQRTPGIRLPNQNPIPSKPTSPITSVATIPATTDQNSSLPGATLPSASPTPQPSPPPQVNLVDLTSPSSPPNPQSSSPKGFPSNRQITNEVHHSNVSVSFPDNILSLSQSPTGVAGSLLDHAGTLDPADLVLHPTEGPPMMKGHPKVHQTVQVHSEPPSGQSVGSLQPSGSSEGTGTPSNPDPNPPGTPPSLNLQGLSPPPLTLPSPRSTPLSSPSPPPLPLSSIPSYITPRPRSLFFKPTSSTSPTQYHPITHMARPQKKAQDWSLAGSKPIRILGDSNINRIPPHTNPTLQLDCYPGAKVYHFMELFKRTPPIPTAKIVIISIGINNKDDDPERTTTKQLNSMTKYAAKTFPRASIYIPLINHSPQLTPVQTHNILTLNNFLNKNHNTLATISPETFRTGQDNIHWTPPTAQLILDSWCRELNF
ncbi:hypothetical protein KUCAC02_037758, partial [Chaenocephalus aceratus]